MGAKTLLWRVEPSAQASPPSPGFRHASIPWLRVDTEGRVIDANPAGAVLAAGRSDLDAILGDPPLRPDGVHILAASGHAARAVVVPTPTGSATCC